MDQRDQAVSELNQLVGITTYEQGDKLNISLASGGQALLSGQTIYPLQAVPSSKDISRTVVAYTLPAGAGARPSRSSWATPKSPAASSVACCSSAPTRWT